MSSGQASHKGTSSEADTSANVQLGMDDQDVQPESGTVREDDIRQSSPTTERVSNKAMEAPEEA